MKPMQRKLEKSCFRCKKNTWHVESIYILQPPKYLANVVNRFTYINNDFTKDKCSKPMHIFLVSGLYKFTLQATIDHLDYLCILTIILPLSTVAKTFYCNDSKITEFVIIDTKNASASLMVMY